MEIDIDIDIEHVTNELVPNVVNDYQNIRQFSDSG